MAINSPSILDHLRALLDDAQDLVRKEIELAKTEFEEKLNQAQNGLIFVFAGLLCVAVATFLLAQSLVAWLAIYLGPAGAALLVGGVVLVIGLIALKLGASRLNARSLKPVRTIRATSENATRLKETLHEQVKRTY
jgi:uncharacterized membrane protein YqjE